MENGNEGETQEIRGGALTPEHFDKMVPELSTARGMLELDPNSMRAVQEDVKAFLLADRLRRDHNGVMYVCLGFSHDGGNYCWFDADRYEEAVIRGDSGASMLEAVQRCMTEWRFQKLSSGQPWANELIEENAREACRFFDESSPLSNDVPNVFTTGWFQTVMNRDQATEGRLTDTQILRLLVRHARIVQLYGGSHWLILPEGVQRHLEPEE